MDAKGCHCNLACTVVDGTVLPPTNDYLCTPCTSRFGEAQNTAGDKDLIVVYMCTQPVVYQWRPDLMGYIHPQTDSR